MTATLFDPIPDPARTATPTPGPDPDELWPRLIDALFSRDRDAALDWAGTLADAFGAGMVVSIPSRHVGDLIHAIHDALGDWSDESRLSPFGSTLNGGHHAQSR